MSSVDEIFKNAGSLGKRKLAASNDVSQFYKSVKTTNDDSPKSTHAAMVEDDVDMDAEAGPELPPSDDEDGRFYGTGMGSTTEAMMDLLDKVDNEIEVQPAQAEKRDSQWIRRMATALRKKITRNESERAKYPDEPLRFMSSEAELDTELRNFSIVSEEPSLYQELVETGCIQDLMRLMVHDNTDIVVRAIELISELTDDDVEATPEQWDAIVNSVVDADLIYSLRDTLKRLEGSEGDEAESGVNVVLSMIEILASRSTLAAQIGRTDGILSWIFKRIQRREENISENKKYASEIISILCNASETCRRNVADVDTLNGVDVILTLLSPYRKTDPPKEEEEFYENLFDSLIIVLKSAPGIEAFQQAQGVPLLLIMLREGRFFKRHALKALEYALNGSSDMSVAAAQDAVEFAGLAVVFSGFMKHSKFLMGDKKAKKDFKTLDSYLGVLESLLRLLPDSSDFRIRTLAKFVEKDYEKLHRLGRLLSFYHNRLVRASDEIEEEKKEVDLSDEEASKMYELVWYERRIEAGLHASRMIACIISWIFAEDDEAKKVVDGLLGSDGGRRVVEGILREYRDDMAVSDSVPEVGENGSRDADEVLLAVENWEDAHRRDEMLGSLIEVLGLF